MLSSYHLLYKFKVSEDWLMYDVCTCTFVDSWCMACMFCFLFEAGTDNNISTSTNMNISTDIISYRFIHHITGAGMIHQTKPNTITWDHSWNRNHLIHEDCLIDRRRSYDMYQYSIHLLSSRITALGRVLLLLLMKKLISYCTWWVWSSGS